MSGNTLAAPKFKDGEQLRTYDYVVANPPFSDKTWTTGLTPSKEAFQRFAWGEPAAKQGDYTYLLHIIRSTKGAGKGACILPHGVLFRGGAEAVIRQQLVRSGYLKGVIGLPANLFYGTSIPACIVVLDKENAAGRKGVFMIDASRGFKKDGPVVDDLGGVSAVIAVDRLFEQISYGYASLAAGEYDRTIRRRARVAIVSETRSCFKAIEPLPCLMAGRISVWECTLNVPKGILGVDRFQLSA